jgi:hypothetical protein
MLNSTEETTEMVRQLIDLSRPIAPVRLIIWFLYCSLFRLLVGGKSAERWLTRRPERSSRPRRIPSTCGTRDPSSSLGSSSLD